MTTIRRALVLMTIATLTLAACGSDDDDDTASEATATTATTASTTDAYGYGANTATTAAAAGGAIVRSASSSLGTILVDGEGRTLYMFTNDSENRSNCTGTCEQTWPPVFGENVSAGTGVDAAKLGTTTSREGGKAQATYNAHPLYRYSGDTKPGDTNGHKVGNTWFVLSPAGNPVR